MGEPVQGDQSDNFQEGRWKTSLTPELRAWALQLTTAEEEAEIIANLKQMREQGGLELHEFIRELEQVVNDSEPTGA